MRLLFVSHKILRKLLALSGWLRPQHIRLIVAAMPFPCKPLMYDAASLPVRYGSSENDSKFRPPRGPRCRQTVGARRTSADLALVSSARCSPTSWSNLVFHVAAKLMPHGNKAAYKKYLSNFTSKYVFAIITHLGSSFEDRSTSAVWAITGLDGRNSLPRNRFRSPEISRY